MNKVLYFPPHLVDYHFSCFTYKNWFRFDESPFSNRFSKSRCTLCLVSISVSWILFLKPKLFEPNQWCERIVVFLPTLENSTDIELSLSQPFHYIIDRSKYQSYIQASSSGTKITGHNFFWHVYVLGQGYFVWPWSPHRHRTSPHRHRTFRDCHTGSIDRYW
jgi:hypothetical protein